MGRKMVTVPATALAWVVFAAAVTFARFGRLPGGTYQTVGALLGFGMLGAIAGWRLAVLVRRCPAPQAVAGALAGHALLAPLGYVFGIVGPLLLEVVPLPPMSGDVTDLVFYPPLIAAVGVVPVLAGQWIGWWLGDIRRA
jgi:hypothetical protein